MWIVYVVTPNEEDLCYKFGGRNLQVLGSAR